MKKWFYIGAIGLALFEVLNVYFIMPMPGSQEMESIDLAYFLYTWRWAFRGAFVILMAIGAYKAYVSRRWLMLGVLVACLALAYLFNFKMAADKMFYQPGQLSLSDSKSNAIPLDKLVLGIELNNEAKAYPIQLIAYHHQVLDTLGGKPIMVTYCSVCRSGRIFEPVVNGAPETFRLVGMDHFNAMFEDESTGSWWRQVSGEAIAGPLKGSALPELRSEQSSLKQWLERYPNSLVMQRDSTFNEEYDDLDDYDFGIERGDLTRTDTLSWKEKSWVVGIESGNDSKAVDWNRLKEERVVNLELGGKPVVVALAQDTLSFYAHARPDNTVFSIRNDTLLGKHRYTIWGEPIDDSIPPLKKINAYQEFWHSWRTFHPETDLSVQD
ncbi:DUF3179 domain-containing (seleno)protein [Flagellimonas sp.]|uniref:DUF3179 domain-containing (seleno)protein n=1 Tax=Flagellimonas sp. TaxID=2058762 RepID=UPI003AB609C7